MLKGKYYDNEGWFYRVETTHANGARSLSARYTSRQECVETFNRMRQNAFKKSLNYFRKEPGRIVSDFYEYQCEIITDKPDMFVVHTPNDRITVKIRYCEELSFNINKFYRYNGGC